MEHSDRVAFASALVRVVAVHDRDTACHLRDTAVLARRIARHMNLDTGTAEAIELAALLHDIGKLGVRRQILGKQSSLTEAEWREMRIHAGAGADLLDEIPLLRHLAPIVRAHHERMDGHGYPDRLRGSEIPLEARVVAVADAYHALTTDRSYRRAVGSMKALTILARAAGDQFDGEIVAALFGVFAARHTLQRRTA